MTVPTATNSVGAVKNLSRILEILKEERGATMSEIEAKTDLSLSSVHNYLATLREEELVVKEGDRYFLSLTFLDLGSVSRNRYKILEGAKLEINELAAETGEMVNLLVEEFGRGIHLYRKGGEKALQYNEYTGYRGYLHNSAAGKCILAYQSSDRVKEIVQCHGFEKTAAHTITDLDELFAELEDIRDAGIAFDDEESLDGCRCVGAPITNKADQKIIGAISVSGPKRRMVGDWFRMELPEMIRDTANVIEVKTSYN
jgi:DNA-binding IclR family transcriptional regulator